MEIRGPSPSTLAGAAASQAIAHGGFHLGAFYDILRFMGRQAIEIPVWGMLPLVCVALLVLGKRGLGPRSNPDAFLMGMAFLVVAAGVTLQFYLADILGQLTDYLGNSANRIYMPAGVLTAMLALLAARRPADDDAPSTSPRRMPAVTAGSQPEFAAELHSAIDFDGRTEQDNEMDLPGCRHRIGDRSTCSSRHRWVRLCPAVGGTHVAESGRRRNASEREFLLGARATRYLDFLAASIPTDGSLVLPEGVGEFSEQNVLQFFLMPRTVPGCSCGGGGAEPSLECTRCLLKPNHYVPAIGGFPGQGILEGSKQYLAYPEDTGWFHGLWLGTPASLGSKQLGAVDPGSALTAAWIDLAIYAALAILWGARLVRPRTLTSRDPRIPNGNASGGGIVDACGVWSWTSGIESDVGALPRCLDGALIGRGCDEEAGTWGSAG